MTEIVYSLLAALFPYSWMEHTFMKNAFLAVVMVTPLFGLLGTMVVSNRMAFFSDSLGHGAFTGIAIGVLLSGVKPLAALVAFSIIFALLIIYIKNKSAASTDTIIGVFSSTAIAVGLMMMSYGGNFNKFSSYLIGDLLSIDIEDLAVLLIVFVAVFIIWIFVFNRLLVVSINRSFAVSRGVRAMGMEMLFAALLAVVVAISIQWVGILLINSLLVLPAAAARNIAGDVRTYHLASVVFALCSGVFGLIGSYYFDTATGATIVLISSALFFITLGLKRHIAG